MSGQNPEIDRQVEEFLRTVSRPSARVDFRERLRQEFLTGPPVEAEAGPARRREPFRFGWVLAAGLLIALGFLLFRSPAAGWQVLHVEPASVVRLNGEIVPVDNLTRLARRLKEADQIYVEKGGLIVRTGDLALFSFGPDTRAKIRGIQGSDGEPIQVIVDSGRLRVRTGPSFVGRSMRIDADLFDASATGTAFAVDYEQHGTCLCCLHGNVTMSSQVIPAGSETISPKRMCLIWRAEPGHEPKRGELPTHHSDPLNELEARALVIWPEP